MELDGLALGILEIMFADLIVGVLEETNKTAEQLPLALHESLQKFHPPPDHIVILLLL